MKLEEFMEKAVSLGIENDPRGKETVEKLLKKRNDSSPRLGVIENQLRRR